MESGKVRKVLTANQGFFYFHLLADGKTLWLREREVLRVCDAATGDTKARWPFAPTLGDVKPAFDGGVLIARTHQVPPKSEVQVLVGDDKEPRLRFLEHDGLGRRCATRDGQRAVSAGGDRVIRVWDTATGTVALTLEGHQGAVHLLALSPAEDRLASAADDGTVRIWELKRKAEPLVLSGQPDGLRVLTFSADGKLLAVGGDDQVLRVWEADTGRLRATFRGHQGAVTDAAFSADGRLLASSAADGSVFLWDVPLTGDSKPDLPPEPIPPYLWPSLPMAIRSSVVWRMVVSRPSTWPARRSKRSPLPVRRRC